MSPAVRRRLYRRSRRLCVECREHQARFQYRGRVRADRDHTLCFRCFRAEVDRQRAVRGARSSACGVRPSVPGFRSQPEAGFVPGRQPETYGATWLDECVVRNNENAP